MTLVSPTLTSGNSTCYRQYTIPQTQNKTVCKSVNYRSLLDSGATNADYVSENFCSELQDIAGYKPTKLTKTKVNSAFLGSSVTIDKQIKFAIRLTSEDGKEHMLNIEARVALIPYDLIIGKQSIKKHDLTALFPSQFRPTDLIEPSSSMESHGAPAQEPSKNDSATSMQQPEAQEPRGLIKRKAELLDISPADDEGYSEKLGKDSDMLHDSEFTRSLNSIQVPLQGQEREQVLEWVQKNKDIMSIGLGKEPARSRKNN